MWLCVRMDICELVGVTVPAGGGGGGVVRVLIPEAGSVCCRARLGKFLRIVWKGGRIW